MSLLIRCCLGAFVVFTLGPSALRAETTTIDPVWLAKAKIEIGSLLRKYSAVASSLDESSEVRADKLPGRAGTIPFYPQTRRKHVIRLGDNILRERIRILDQAPNSPVIKLECDNADYFFTLGKSKEDAPYALVEYAPGRRGAPLIEQQPAFHDWVFSHLPNALAALDNNGGKTLKGVHFDEVGKLLSIEFSYTEGSMSYSEQHFYDPNQEWRIVELRRDGATWSITDHFSYGLPFTK